MNHRQKREARIANAHKVAQELDPHIQDAVPSEYGFSVLPKDVKQVIFFDRVSHHSQQLQEHFSLKGVKITHSFTATETGKGIDPQKRPTFYRAVKRARKTGLPILATCFSRYLRASDYNIIFGRDSQPSTEELELFLETTEGVVLYTLNDPDVTPEEDRVFLLRLSEQQRALQRKREKSGSTKRRKLHHIELVFQLHKQGVPLQQIRKQLLSKRGVSVSVNTLSRWVGKGK